MTFCDKFRTGKPTLSYEFFPPKDPGGWGTLYTTLGSISRQAPDFVSVTYGAGGSTRRKTVDIVSRIQNELDIQAMAHLTCVNHSREELHEILTTLDAAGIKHVMALRGDAPKGSASFAAHPEGFAHGSDLIAYISANFNFQIGCGYYPEKHVEAESLEQDIAYLKLKQDNGASFAVSQLFFDNDVFFRFRDQVAAAGITLPLVAGIMPVSSLSQLRRFEELGTRIPDKLTDFLGEGDDATIAARGIEFATEQSRELLDNGIVGVHFYTLNKSKSSVKITDNLRTMGYFPVRRSSTGK
jgi:methylenetetrahydrofolate reductase (NADPH)